MGAVLSLTLPIYLLMGAGFGAVKTGWLLPAQVAAVGQVVLRLCLPALIFTAVLRSGEGGALNGGFMAAYLGASLVVLLAGQNVIRRAFGQPPALAWILALGMSSANSAFVGYPVTALVFGPDIAGTVLAWTMIVENMIMIPLAMVLADGAGGGGSLGRTLARIARGLATNPLVLAIVAALALLATGLHLPEPVARAFAMLSAVAPGAALLVVGGTVASAPVRGQGGQVAAIALGKLVAHPVAVFCALWLVPGLDAGTRVVGTVFAAAPMLSIFPILAERHGGATLAASAMVTATACSFATVNLLLWWLV